MSGANSLADETGSRPSLRDRILGVFRTSSSTSFSGFPDNIPVDDGTQDLDPGVGSLSGEPDARTRLLESYNRHDPLCGQRSCDHGTFSPRPEEHENSPWAVRFMQKNGNYGRNDEVAGDMSNSAQFSRPTSAPRSDTMQSMESSFSTPFPKHRKTLYVQTSKGPLSFH